MKNNQCPTWQKFLDELIPDTNMQKELQQLMGKLMQRLVRRAGQTSNPTHALHKTQKRPKSVRCRNTNPLDA